jgi:sulfatase modifying factor 1
MATDSPGAFSMTVSVASSYRNRQAFSFYGAVWLIFFLLNCSVAKSDVVTFGNQTASFSLTFLDVDNPGNAADNYLAATGFGSVGYSYDIGANEISQKMIDVYNQLYGSLAENPNSSINYLISVGTSTDKPATQITWNEAAMFVNWLNTSSGGFRAYNMVGGVSGSISPWSELDVADYDPANPYRSKRAIYALPTRDEWHKAAFYDPTMSGGLGGYRMYATSESVAPTAVGSGTTVANSAVYKQSAAQGPAIITSAGGVSYYGAMAMNGNASEWTESPVSTGSGGVILSSDFTSNASRYVRGGGWTGATSSLLARDTFQTYTAIRSLDLVGFRVARVNTNGAAGEGNDGGGVGALSSVPEPGSVGFLAAFAGLSLRKLLRRT